MRIFSPAGHVTEDSLALHSLNDLPLSQAERVEGHLSACAACSEHYRETREFITMVRNLAQNRVRSVGMNCAVGAIRLRTAPRLRVGRPSA